jgi:hypothetical protein
MKRRTVLQLIAIGAATPLGAQHAGHAPAATAAAATVKRRFFSEAQGALIDCLAEMILPADKHSPGAREDDDVGINEELLDASLTS